jgi:hypothetical protein
MPSPACRRRNKSMCRSPGTRQGDLSPSDRTSRLRAALGRDDLPRCGIGLVVTHSRSLRARVAAAVGVTGALPRQAKGTDEVEVAAADAVCRASTTLVTAESRLTATRGSNGSRCHPAPVCGTDV